MLNPKLIEVFGEDTVVFFDALVNNIGPDMADKCYALSDETVQFGNVTVPDCIAVCDSSDVASDIGGKCIMISYEIKRSNNIPANDDLVLCLPYIKSDAEREGIKIWVR